MNIKKLMGSRVAISCLLVAVMEGIYLLSKHFFRNHPSSLSFDPLILGMACAMWLFKPHSALTWIILIPIASMIIIFVYKMITWVTSDENMPDSDKIKDKN